MSSLGFDSAFYLDQNSDVRAAVENGVFASAAQHFELFGAKEGRDPNIVFDTEAYGAANTDVANAVSNNVIDSLYEHYLAFGITEDRPETPAFNPQFYADNNTDVVNALGTAPASLFEHYIQFGLAEGRPGSAPNVSASGSVQVDGQGPASDIPARAGTLEIGVAGDGSVTASGGAQFTFTSDNFNNVNIGAPVGNVGTLNLNGHSAKLTTAGTDNTIQVGRFGTGTLTVDNGAQLSTLQLEAGREGNGTITLRGGGTLATASPDNGRFSGTEFVDEAGFVRAGRDAGSFGRIEVLNGAELEIIGLGPSSPEVGGAFLQLARNDGSEGELLIDGIDSSVQIESFDAPFEPGFEIARDGIGDVTISNGGRFIVNGLDGAAFARVAKTGSGTLDVESGGQVLIDGTFSDTGFTQIVLGDDVGGTGTATITGAGSQLIVEGGQNSQIRVGDLGDGELFVENGGHASAEIVIVARQAGGSGLLDIRGEQSSVEVKDEDADGDGLLLVGVDFDSEAGGFSGGGQADVAVGNGGVLDVGADFEDGIADIIIGDDDTLIVEDGGSLIGDVQIIGGGSFELADGATHFGDVL